MKILILGGYGTFGGRLAQLLADESRLTLLIAGRSLEKAREFCAKLSPRATLVPVTFDRNGDVESALRELAPDLLVDASGPFQVYGDRPYRVVEACLALGVNYLDLSDSSAFVDEISRFNEHARQRGIFILAGVSSFPVLTAAVVRRLSQGMTRLDTVTGGIAPSPYAGVGLNVIRAIASYAGRQVALTRDGRKTKGYALIDTHRFTIAPPGKLPLHSLRFSLVDVPDLHALPQLWPALRSVWIGVAPVPAVLHRVLNVFAQLVRYRCLPSLSTIAPLMHGVINVLRWGEHRGGMFVQLEGVNADGKRAQRSWHLLAEGNDGPFIPSMATEAIVRRCLEKRNPPSGARAATQELELNDYEQLFARRTIYTGIRETIPTTAPLYRRVLNAAWNELPAPIREMHNFVGEKTVEGLATVTRGNGLIAKFIAFLFRFPKAGQDIPVTVTFTSRDGIETWQRRFAGSLFSSTQEEGRDRFERLMCERFGPFMFGVALVLENDRVRLVPRRWTAFGIPMPKKLLPTGESYESAESGRFNFHIEISHPWFGLIVKYRGWLEKHSSPT